MSKTVTEVERDRASTAKRRRDVFREFKAFMRVHPEANRLEQAKYKRTLAAKYNVTTASIGNYLTDQSEIEFSNRSKAIKTAKAAKAKPKAVTQEPTVSVPTSVITKLLARHPEKIFAVAKLYNLEVGDLLDLAVDVEK